MSNPRQPFADLYRFIKGIFLKGDTVTKLEVKHLQISDSGSRSHRLLERLEKDLKEEPDSISSSIIEEATADAKNFGGLQKYIVLYYTEKGGDEPRGRCVFSIAGSLEKDEYGVVEGSEPANEKGITAQLMRHSETKERVTMAFIGRMMDMYETRLERQERVIERSADREIKILELVSSLEDRKLERDIEIRKMEREEKVKDKLFSKVDLLFPIIQAKLLPQSNLKEGLNIDPRLLSLFESMSEAQLMKLVDTFTDDQKATFGEVYMMYREYDRKKKEENKNAAE